MRFKWLIPGALTVMALLLVILFSQGAGQAQEPLADLIVTKSVSPSTIAPGEMVMYSVVLSNTTGVTLEVSSLVDTSPDGFEYAGLAPGNQWDVPPWDTTPPDIQWAGPITVPASASLTINYWIWVPESVPLSGDPYTNTVVADLNGETYQAEAGLLVGVGKVSIDKVADPLVVNPGESVTYTIAFSNSGYVSVPLATVTDVLPSGVTFVRMSDDSDIPSPPDGVTGEIEWTGPFTIDPRAEFVVEYVAAMPPTSDTVVLENQAWGQLGDGTVLGPAGEVVRVGASEPMTMALPLVTRNWAPPAFTVVKTADPEMAYAQTPGELINYTVVFVNEGTVAGTLANVRDLLPTGFTFVQMLPGSDISDPPSSTTGLIVWVGPYVVEGGSSLTLIFQVQASSVPGTYANYATATVLDGRSPAAPAQATVQVVEPPAFTVAKTAEPAVVYAKVPGELITFSVVLVNEGSVAGTLVNIRDLLPTGFTFLQMLPESDVSDPPSGSTGLIVWAGPYVVEEGSSLTLIFQVRASSVRGTYVNLATATALDGQSPDAPAQATVQVIDPILLSETWENPSPYWEPFLNYWRLNSLQWHVDSGIGVNGSAALNHTYWYGVEVPEDGADDALYFYNAPGADTWTNYRMEARVKLDVGLTQGFWIRAKYIPSDLGGRHVEGYYLVWKPAKDLVKLSYVVDEGKWAYHFALPIELTRATYPLQKGVWYNIAVEVRGSNIKAYVDGNLVIDFDHDRYSSGTVGFYAYQLEQAAWDNVVVTQLP